MHIPPLIYSRKLKSTGDPKRSVPRELFDQIQDCKSACKLSPIDRVLASRAPLISATSSNFIGLFKSLSILCV